MTINGNLAFASGAQYFVSLNPSTSSFANVTGTATLGNATVNAMFANGSYVAKTYTILTRGQHQRDVRSHGRQYKFAVGLSYGAQL